MNLYEEIIRDLKRRRENGETQQQIASKAGISRVHVCTLLSGKSKTEKMELETFLKLFPKATIILTGDSPVIHAPRNNGIVTGVNHGNVSGDCYQLVCKKILADDSLSAEEKVKFMKTLEK